MPSVPQPPDSERDRILILDYGSQFTQLIARRIREQKVYCEIHPAGMEVEAVRAWNPAGIVLSGGPASVLDAGVPDLDLALLDLGRPVLGVCYGMQLLVHRLGGVVERSEDREYGRALLKVEWALAFFLHQSPGFVFPLALGPCTQVFHGQGDGRSGGNNLYQLPIHGGKGGPQGFMAPDYLIEALF